jgi:hypothetical protein
VLAPLTRNRSPGAVLTGLVAACYGQRAALCRAHNACREV